MSGTRFLDVAIVGAGFGGLYAIHRLRNLDLDLDLRAFEAGSGIGGTWFWNRYPGARCDVESMAYSYSFSSELERDWDWSERYATQPEILDYANHVADRFDLRRDIQLDTRVTSIHLDEAGKRWLLRMESGEAVSARFVIMATGCLSCQNIPEFKGLDRFEGECFHTSDWPEEGAALRGKRVGVIGTGSTAIQAIPCLAEEAERLFVFQRTPNYSMPARNVAMTEAYRSEVRSTYPEFRQAFLSGLFGLDFSPSDRLAVDATAEERTAEFERRWADGGLGLIGAFADLFVNEEANISAGDFIRAKIRETVDDPETAELLCPDTMVGCKRPCADSGYYETYNRSNVELVDISEAPIEEISAKGVVTDGREYPLDVIVFATGFDAMTGALLRSDIRGVGGIKLEDRWAEGPKTYLGLAIDAFPNLFTVTGPGSPSVLANMIPAIEQHIDWIADCIRYMHQHGYAQIEAEPTAVEQWVTHVNDVANRTLYPTCNSWYLGANIPGKPRVFMPYLGFPPYKKKCDEVAGNDYEGFRLSR